MCGELPQSGGENTLEKGMVMMIIGDYIETKDLLIEEDTLVEDPLIEMEDPLEEDTLMEVGDPLIGGYPGGGPPDGGGGPPEDKDHQALKDLLGP